MKPEEIVRRFGMEEDEFDDRWRNTPKRVWRGGGSEGWWEFDNLAQAFLLSPTRMAQKPDGWFYVEGWNDGRYRAVWVNPSQRATFTYCEGDTCLVVCGDLKTWADEITGACRCYGPPAHPECIAPLIAADTEGEGVTALPVGDADDSQGAETA